MRQYRQIGVKIAAELKNENAINIVCSLDIVVVLKIRKFL